MHQANSKNSKLNAFLEATPQPVASDGAVLHEEQHKRSRMDDFCDSGRVINYELALQASLTINYVQQKKLPFFLRQKQQMPLFAIITVRHT